ncbi:MAG: hypothetical protein Q4C96_00150 [Planctomycetia bacterium]|nr:hypothetical protein [Planctomycetia bacterium]
MDKIFSENDFFLQYPSDWKLEEDADRNGETINLYPPGGCGFWSLSRYPATVTESELSKAVLETITAEYVGSEVSPAQDAYGMYALKGYDVEFFYVDFPCCVTIRTIQHGQYTYLLFTQRSDTVEEHLTDMFSQITECWVENLNHCSDD